MNFWKIDLGWVGPNMWYNMENCSNKNSKNK